MTSTPGTDPAQPMKRDVPPPPRTEGVALGDRPTSPGPAASVTQAGHGVPHERAVAPGSRHVWVAPVPGADGEEHAGLLHLWRRMGGESQPAAWWALVTYLVDDADQPEPVQVTSWVPAQMVRRAPVQ